MNSSALFTHPYLPFCGIEGKIETAEYLLLGVPLDITSTYRPGSRFGPAAIREASWNLETYCIRTGLDVEDCNLYDQGDLNVLGDLKATLQRLRQVMEETIAAQKIPITLGGEHTITYSCVETFNDVAVLSFDAHMDLRDKYLGLELSHATFMRRLCESLGADKIVEVGVRAFSEEELDYANKENLRYITSRDIKHKKLEKIVKEVKAALSPFKQIYLTLDMDVLDPSFAPAVGNPVPEGLSPNTLLNILQPLCDQKIVGFDLVELSPHYDYGISAIQAAHIIFNILSFLEYAK
jgi:agmatinase